MNKSLAIISACAGAIIGGAYVKHVFKEQEIKTKEENKKLEKSFTLYYHWFLLKQNNVNISDFFIENGIENIAVLDLSAQGRRFIDELKGTDINVLYAIEKYNPAAIHETLDVLRLDDDDLPACDAVVVCSMEGFPEIERKLKEKLGEECKVISLQTVLMQLLDSNSIDATKGALDTSSLKVTE